MSTLTLGELAHRLRRSWFLIPTFLAIMVGIWTEDTLWRSIATVLLMILVAYAFLAMWLIDLDDEELEHRER